MRIYPLSPLTCHSRARGPRKHEYVCGVDKAGIGLGLLLVIFNRGNNSVLCFLSVTRDMNLIDLIPAYAGMTKKVWAWAITPLCHRERSVAIQ